MPLNIRDDKCELDFLALGAMVHRLDPGVIPFRRARGFDIHVSGGEYNVAANLASCFGKQTAIAAAMVDNGIAKPGIQQALGQRHANRICKPLAKGTGCGFHTGGVSEFRMSGGARSELPKVLQLLDGHVLVAQQMQGGVEQHGSVSGRKNKPIPIRPVWRAWIEFKKFGKQHGGNVSRPQRQAGMPGFGLLHRVHCQEPYRIGHAIVFFCIGHRCLVAKSAWHPVPASVGQL